MVDRLIDYIYLLSQSKKNENEIVVLQIWQSQEIPYMTTHFDFFLLRTFGDWSVMILGARNKRTRFMNKRSTFCAVLAEVSRNWHPNCCARAAPSSLETSRSDVWSHLLPTSKKIGLPCLTRLMDCRNRSRRLNVNREAIEYTRMNP